MNQGLLGACIQAAATLVAARDAGKSSIDADGVVKLAEQLYEKATGEKPEKATPGL